MGCGVCVVVVEADVWSSHGGQPMEAGGRCRLMEVGVCERE